MGGCFLNSKYSTSETQPLCDVNSLHPQRLSSVKRGSPGDMCLDLGSSSHLGTCYGSDVSLFTCLDRRPAVKREK